MVDSEAPEKRARVRGVPRLISAQYRRDVTSEHVTVNLIFHCQGDGMYEPNPNDITIGRTPSSTQKVGYLGTTFHAHGVYLPIPLHSPERDGVPQTWDAPPDFRRYESNPY